MRTKSKRVILFVILGLLLVALPTSTVLANKQAWKALISYQNEVTTVVDSVARGTGNFGTNQNGSIHFIVSVRGLSEAPTGAHLHAPAGVGENAGVVVTLCGTGPGVPVIAGPCPFSDGDMVIEGDIMGGNLTGISGGDFFNALRNDMVYFNVHTSLNPAGEARGQLIQR